MRTFCLIALLPFLQYVASAEELQGMPEANIGENITAKIMMSYDSNYSSKFETYAKGKNITEYLIKLVEKAQESFHNQSIMINFTVLNVTKRDDFFAYYSNGSVDGWGTLGNMVKYGISQNASNDTIYCHSSGNSIYGDYWKNIQTYRLTDMATNSTFCRNVSALLFIEFPGKGNPRSLVKALGTTMGAQNNFIFTEEDKTRMNETFANCGMKERKKRRGKGKGARKEKGRTKKKSNS